MHIFALLGVSLGLPVGIGTVGLIAQQHGIESGNTILVGAIAGAVPSLVVLLGNIVARRANADVIRRLMRIEGQIDAGTERFRQNDLTMAMIEKNVALIKQQHDDCRKCR